MLALGDRPIPDWLRWACKAARRIAPRWLPADECDSAAGWALARALATRDPARGPWTPWLRMWVRTAVRDEATRWKRRGLVTKGSRWGLPEPFGGLDAAHPRDPWPAIRDLLDLPEATVPDPTTDAPSPAVRIATAFEWAAVAATVDMTIKPGVDPLVADRAIGQLCDTLKARLHATYRRHVLTQADPIPDGA